MVERLEKLKGGTQDFILGADRPPFPSVVDNTMRCAFRKCPTAFRNEYLFCRSKTASSIHLVAGAAFAAGNDAFIKAYHTVGGAYEKDFELAFAAGVKAMIEAYGWDETRDADPSWKESPKSCDRIMEAMWSYWHEYHPKVDHFKISMDGDVPRSEMELVQELDVLHPETGKPLIMHGRADCVREYNGKLWLVDDKTTASLGASWARQWDTRSQFMGYTRAARMQGLDVAGVLVRGTGILKTKITHMQVPVAINERMVGSWYEQVNRDFERAIEAWRSGVWDRDYSEGCNQYGGCYSKESCLAKFESQVLDLMPIRIWNPEEPENSIVWRG